MRNRVLKIVFLLLSFAIPFGLYTFTKSDSLSFSDAGEFAIVTKIASVAHGPGFPSYVMLGWIWSSIVSLFTHSHLISIMLFSIVSISAAAALLFLISYRLLQRNYPNQNELMQQLIAFSTALAFAFGFTAWYWANNVEVYAFHVFTFALMVYGLTEFNHSCKTRDVIIAAIGLALGLANHHLTTIFFLPFLLAFLGKNIFKMNQKTPNAKKKKRNFKDDGIPFFNFLRSKQFKIFLLVTGGLLVFFYGWMMWRAGADLPFKFGQPDTLSRLFFHVSGGAFIHTMTNRAEGMASMRFPYFIWLLKKQFGFFLILIVLGLIELFRRRYFFFAIAILGYFLLMQSYQLGLDQFFDSDGYMLSSYWLLSLSIPFGAMWVMEKRKELVFALPVFIAIQLIFNFPLDDKRNHDVSKSMMKCLDESAPKNSVIIAADWSLVAQYYYYRIGENFRPDLVLLNYDLKFTNWKILPTMYPDFYKQIKPEYDDFIQKLGAAHPEQIYDTGDSFDSDGIFEAYKKVIYKIKNICAANNTAMLIDPQAFVFLVNQKVLPDNYYASGCFVSETKTTSTCQFEKLPFKWLDQPLLKYEAGCSDKLVDIQAMLDFNSNYFSSIGDTARALEGRRSYDHILAVEKELKSNLPFIYRKAPSGDQSTVLK